MMAKSPRQEFGKRKPVAVQTAAPVKRSGHVALLLMGTVAIGAGAYAMMPGSNCKPTSPGTVAPSTPQTSADCSSRGSFIRRRPWRIVVAQQLLWRQFLVEQFIVEHGFRVRFGCCDARRVRLVCAGVRVACLRRRLTSFHAAHFMPRTQRLARHRASRRIRFSHHRRRALLGRARLLCVHARRNRTADRGRPPAKSMRCASNSSAARSATNAICAA